VLRIAEDFSRLRTSTHSCRCARPRRSRRRPAGGPGRRVRRITNIWAPTVSGVSIRVVDYEFAGYSDLAFDCADLTEHISSREGGIDDETWAEIVSLAGLDDHDRHRF